MTIEEARNSVGKSVAVNDPFQGAGGHGIIVLTRARMVKVKMTHFAGEPLADQYEDYYLPAHCRLNKENDDEE